MCTFKFEQLWSKELSKLRWSLRTSSPCRTLLYSVRTGINIHSPGRGRHGACIMQMCNHLLLLVPEEDMSNGSRYTLLLTSASDNLPLVFQVATFSNLNWHRKTTTHLLDQNLSMWSPLIGFSGSVNPRYWNTKWE